VEKQKAESRKRKRILLVFLLSAFCFLFSCTPKPHHPNVLLITLDTFRADRLGRETPNLERLAKAGLRFSQADAAAPLTLPSHATILSGLLPPHHGLRNNGIGSFPAKDDTLATIFLRAGYRTGAFVSAFVLDRRFGLARGFGVYDDAVPRDPNDTAVTFEAERRGGETVDRALAWLRRPDARPWFAWVHLYDAHAPYAPPPPYPRTYDGEVQYVDVQIGRLLAAVDPSKTIIVVAGDHGEALGEHGELTHGLLLYEPTLHVPLIVAAPALRAREIDDPVSTADIAPTIATLAGLSLKSDGHDISKTVGAEWIYAETEYPATFGWSPLSAARSSDRKFIRGVAAELFDLRRDPGEKRNLADTDRRDVRQLADQLDAIAKSAVASATGRIDEETRSKLASLGYVAPGVATVRRIDARQMAPLFRRFEEANGSIPILEQLVKEDPGNPAFRSTLARAYKQSGALDRAIALYREAVALSPADPDAWYNLATALQEGGRGAEAKKVAEEAERLDPSRPDTHNVLGIALVENGDPAAAEQEFRNAIDLDPRNARAYNNLGNVLRITGRGREAAAAYGKALEITPNYADALNGLGVVAVQEGRTAEAIERFDAALKVAPDYFEAQLNRAIALQVSGDRRAASEELRRLLARLPKGRAYDPQRNAARALLSSGGR